LAHAETATEWFSGTPEAVVCLLFAPIVTKVTPRQVLANLAGFSAA